MAKCPAVAAEVAFVFKPTFWTLDFHDPPPVSVSPETVFITGVLDAFV